MKSFARSKTVSKIRCTSGLFCKLFSFSRKTIDFLIAPSVPIIPTAVDFDINPNALKVCFFYNKYLDYEQETVVQGSIEFAKWYVATMIHFFQTT